MKHNFSTYEALAYGFNQFFKYFSFIFALSLHFGASIVLLTIFYFGSYGLLRMEYTVIGYSMLVFSVLAGLLVIPTLLYGYIKALMVLDKEGKSSVMYLYRYPQYSLSFLCATLLYLCVGSVGILLLCIPGFYWLGTRGFYDFLMIEKKMGPWQALVASARITHDDMMHITWFYAALFFVQVLIRGTILGVFVSLPVGIFTRLYLYKLLVKDSDVLDMVEQTIE